MKNSNAVVQLAVVGHANTGKTSLIRTLLRDTRFGEVADYSGTTRHVEGAELTIRGERVLEVFDTPGLEDSVALKQAWNAEKFDESQSRSEQMSAFIKRLDSLPDFAQEQKVLRQAFRSDVLLYVIDAREPYLGKYEDEITLLGLAGRPIVPVLNFIAADDQNKQRWREKLVEHGLHAVVEYDTVAFTMEAERRLFEKLQTLVEAHYETFQNIIEHNAEQYSARCRAAANAIAEQYINVAAYRITVDQDTVEASTPKLQSLVRNAEQKTVDELLSIFGFDKGDIRNEYLPVTDGRWELDLFDSHTYKEFGLQAGSGAAKGAAMGVGVDLFVGGVSLGMGAAIGAVAGVIWNSVQKYGGSIMNTFTGSSYVCVDGLTVKLFYLRQQYLLQSLMARGHAAQDVLALNNDQQPEQYWPAAVDSITRQVRAHHKWSTLDNAFAGLTNNTDKERLECKRGLVTQLLKINTAESGGVNDAT